ncbi:ATP-dependent DNA helicase [Trichonephila clavipes]|nr:ATP-dependent DNA helicase [Trichonephila clavipes]
MVNFPTFRLGVIFSPIPNRNDQRTVIINGRISCIYGLKYDSHKNAHKDFQKRFVDNPFDYGCSIYERLCFRDDLRTPVAEHKNILLGIDLKDIKACYNCLQSSSRKSIPNLSKYNGFVYPEIPAHLPTLDLVSERLISPRIPFMQIRRLRHVHGQFGILGQIINVPVSINTMVNRLPRNVEDDYCVNVHIKRRKIHRTSYLMVLVTKRTLNAWLQYLVATPSYRMYGVTIDDSFFNLNQSTSQVPQEEISENITIEESLTAQQQTLLWNEEKYLRISLLEKRMYQEACYMMNMLRSFLSQEFTWIILETSGKELEKYFSNCGAPPPLRGLITLQGGREHIENRK